MDAKTGFLAGVAVTAVVAILYIWLDNRMALAKEYTDALATCSYNPKAGATKIRSLQAIYGEKSVPKKIALDASICRLKSN